MEISKRIEELALNAEIALEPHFRRIDAISFENTKKIMNAFRNHRVSEAMFAPTSGYGYDDKGRAYRSDFSLMGTAGGAPEIPKSKI